MFQSLYLGMQGSDPKEATAFLCDMLKGGALPFVSKDFQLFESIAKSTDPLLTHSLCCVGRAASAAFPASHYLNGLGANFRWDEDLWPILTSATSAVKAGVDPLGPSLDISGTALSFLASFIRRDVARGSLTRSGCRGRPLCAFHRHGARECLKVISRLCVDAYSDLPSLDFPLEANQCLKCMVSVLSSVYKVHMSEEADGAQILKDDVVRIMEKKGRNEYVRLLDADIREEVCLKVGKKVDINDVVGAQQDEDFLAFL